MYPCVIDHSIQFIDPLRVVFRFRKKVMGSIGLFGAVEVEKAGVSFEGHASITAGGSFSGSISTGPNAHLEKATPITAGTFVTIAGEAELGKGDPEALPEAAKNFIPGFVSSVLLAFSFDVSWDAKGRKEGTGFALDFGVTPSVLEGAGFTKSVGFFGVQVGFRSYVQSYRFSSLTLSCIFVRLHESSVHARIPYVNY